jgi:5'-3' exonuclease
MTTYLLIDLTNTYFRARHSAHRANTIEEKVAFAIHVTLASINKCWRDQRADHVIFCLEGRSWRKDFYKPYKANRAEARSAYTEVQQEEDRQFWEGLDHLKEFFTERTNCTVLRHPELEADDLIAGWIQSHPESQHVIVSSDTDFYQLLAENVKQYNGIADELHTLSGIFDKKGKLVIDKKTKEPKVIPDPKFILFEKCMRGDPTDNIFSAYPGVRTKGSKNKVGLIEAFADRDMKGFNWNNLMLQKWVDHNGVEHKVLDDYNRNCTLVDLSAQPADIRAKIAETIAVNSVAKQRPMIGTYFLKFCGKHDLQKLSDQAQTYSDIFGSEYQG